MPDNPMLLDICVDICNGYMCLETATQLAMACSINFQEVPDPLIGSKGLFASQS